MSAAPNTSPAPAPYTSRFVQARGLRIRLLDYGGQGRLPMLCLHGGGANGHWFDYIAGAFTGDHHVMALDQRGHGDSDWAEPPVYTYQDYASDLAAIVETMGIRDYVLMGHSMGGIVSLLYAGQRPQGIRALIVIDSNMRMSPKLLEGMNERGQRQGNSFATLDDYVAKYRLRPGETVAPRAVVEYIGRHSARQYEDGQWRHKLDRRVMATRTMADGVPFWNRIAMPALYVKGGNSPRLTPQIKAEIQLACPQARFAEVSNADHHVTLDNPVEFSQKVRGFLDTL
jgi:pimeloyl-ACP methyl ester carboxylesterase